MKSQRFLRAAYWGWLGVAALPGCSSEKDTTVCTPGSQRCACAAADSCNPGLSCVDRVCVALAGSGGESSVGGTEPFASGGTTSETLGGSPTASGGAVELVGGSSSPGTTSVMSPSGGTPGAGGTSSATTTDIGSGGMANPAGGSVATSLGGMTAIGGVTSTGGTEAIAGTTSTGGALSNGGTASGGATLTGATTTAGGNTGTGGTLSLGGATSTGGTPITGGAPPTTGGAPGSGGNATGGTASQLGPNLIKNGDFSSATASWHVTTVNGIELSTATVGTDGAYCVTASSTYTAQVIGWPVVVEDAAYLQQNTTYLLSYRAMSPSSVSSVVYITPKVGLAIAPYTNVYAPAVSSPQTNTWQTMQATFTTGPNFLSTAPVGLAFNITLYGGSLCIDDVVLAKVGG